MPTRLAIPFARVQRDDQAVVAEHNPGERIENGANEFVQVGFDPGRNGGGGSEPPSVTPGSVMPFGAGEVKAELDYDYPVERLRPVHFRVCNRGNIVPPRAQTGIGDLNNVLSKRPLRPLGDRLAENRELDRVLAHLRRVIFPSLTSTRTHSTASAGSPSPRLTASQDCSIDQPFGTGIV